MNATSRIIATGLLAVGACSASHAADAGESHFGAWQGRIGNTRVQVCFSRYGEGQYYYLRHRAGIRLQIAKPPADVDRFEMMKQALAQGEVELEEASGTFASDAPSTGRWHLHADGDGWIGEWRNPAGTKQLPIKLARLQTVDANPNEDSGECPSSFYAPLREELRVTYADTDYEGHPYRSMTTTPAMAMELAENTPAAKAIHTYAMNWLRDQAVFAYDCSLGNGGGSIALDRTLEPIVWTARYLVLRDSLPETYCGGAHGNAAQDHIVWDLDAGTRVETWSWIDGGEAAMHIENNEDGSTTRSAFSELLRQQHPRNVADDECAEVLDFMSVAAPYPTATGLVFPTSFFHAMRVCGDDITLTWPQVEPHLSSAGKAVMEDWVE